MINVIEWYFDNAGLCAQDGGLGVVSSNTARGMSSSLGSETQTIDRFYNEPVRRMFVYHFLSNSIVYNSFGYNSFGLGGTEK